MAKLPAQGLAEDCAQEEGHDGHEHRERAMPVALDDAHRKDQEVRRLGVREDASFEVVGVGSHEAAREHEGDEEVVAFGCGHIAFHAR